MTRKVTDSVLSKIKQWEGLRLQAYQDVGGVWTIGYGHTGPDVQQGSVITMEQAENYLRLDLKRFETVVNNNVMVPLSDNQFGALVSFTFNVGEKAFAESTLVKLLNKGDYNSVPVQLARWVHAGGKEIKGLVNRRAAEAGLWASGSFVSSAPIQATVPPPSWLTKEMATTTATTLSAVAAAVSTPGPQQWLFAALTVASYGINALQWWVKQKEQLH